MTIQAMEPIQHLMGLIRQYNELEGDTEDVKENKHEVLTEIVQYKTNNRIELEHDLAYYLNGHSSDTCS